MTRSLFAAACAAGLSLAMLTSAIAETSSTQQTYIEHQMACAGLLLGNSAAHAETCGGPFNSTYEPNTPDFSDPPVVIIDPCLGLLQLTADQPVQLAGC